MKILKFDRKAGELRLITENLEDIWHVERSLAIGDEVESDTFRTVKFGTKEEKKPMHIAIKIENIEFSKSLNRLRLLGKIIRGHPEEFIQMGKYHTLDVEIGTKIIITKQWKNYQIKRFEQAEKETKKPKLRIIVLDEEHALTAVVRGYGIEYGFEMENEARKRDESKKFELKNQQYLEKLMNEIGKHDEKYLVAGPGFTKDNLKKFIELKNPGLLKRIIFESCSYAERSGILELFNGGTVEKIMGEQRLQKELKYIEKVITEAGKESGMAVCGLESVKKANREGKINKLLVLDDYMRSSKEVEELVENADNKGAYLIIFSAENDAGIKLSGLGGIAAILN
jgi:protein pelota